MQRNRLLQANVGCILHGAFVPYIIRCLFFCSFSTVQPRVSESFLCSVCFRPPEEHWAEQNESVSKQMVVACTEMGKLKKRTRDAEDKAATLEQQLRDAEELSKETG